MQHGTSYEVLISLLFSSGQPVKLGFVGGSCSEGAGLQQSPYDKGIWQNFPHRLTVLAQTIFNNPHITMYNGASGGSRSDYMSLCIHRHLPPGGQVDIVYIEYAVNDRARLDNVKFSDDRAAMEILIRRLLRLPSKPAVVMLNGFRWTNAVDRRKNQGLYYNNAEADYIEFSTYYHLPTISIKAGTYHLMKSHVPGFRIDNMLEDVPGGWNDTLTKPQIEWLALRYNTSFFIGDGVHPAGQSGHRAYAEILIHQIVKVAFGLHRRPLSEYDHRFIDGTFTNATVTNTDTSSSASPLFLPPPVIKNNYEPSSPSCYFGESLKNDVPSVVSSGFTWVDDSKEGWRTKLGWKTTEPNSKIEFSLDMRSLLNPLEIKPNQETAAIRFQLIYLRSYDKMGKARASCDGGCSCSPTVFEGQWNERMSITVTGAIAINVFLLGPKKRDQCQVTVLVLEETTSGGHKFKIAGISMTNGFIYAGDFNHPALELLSGRAHEQGGAKDIDRTTVQKGQLIPIAST